MIGNGISTGTSSSPGPWWSCVVPTRWDSRWCFAEITQARFLGKTLFPVIIRPCEMVGPLAVSQAIDLVALGEEAGFARPV